MTTVPRFPRLPQQVADDNAAIQIFGRRFYKDQTDIEYLVEFLLVYFSEKTIGDQNIKWKYGFPSRDVVTQWPDNTVLNYTPEPRLGLKLFSFLGSSKLETRHESHKKHFKKILSLLKDRIQTESYDLSEAEVLEVLEQLLCGFVGVSANRTWCTQVFLPISEQLIAGETIWRRVQGNKNPDISWEDAVSSDYFSFTQHDFLARGGEVLYLQLCNLMRHFDSDELIDFEKSNKFDHGQAEQALFDIREGVESFFQQTKPIDELCEWVGSADNDTNDLINRNPAQCGWCPEESWKETYLFSIELRNILKASIDPHEKIEMLTLCCVFQVLRSLCAQACRYNNALSSSMSNLGGANGFAWIATPEKLENQAFRKTATQNLTRVQEIIYGALRHPDILPPIRKSKPNTNVEKKADEQGHELFLQLGKRIGFIIPRTGPGARFVISDKILRFLVLALVPPGEKRTLRSFCDRLFCHFGIAINGPELEKAVRWSHPRQTLNMPSVGHEWFEENLLAAGFLIPLSDAVSQVQNPFSQKAE